MIKKEFRDTLRILLESSILLLSIPFILLLTLIMGGELPVFKMIKLTLSVTIIGFACYSGLSLFQSERKEKGFEYLFTLPMHRLKVFCYKTFPRIVVLAVLVIISRAFFDTGTGYVIACFYIQFTGIFLSLAFPSLLPGVISIILLGFIFTLAKEFFTFIFYKMRTFSFDPFDLVSPDAVAALLLVIPLAVAFIIVLKNLDLKSHILTVKPYLFIAAPLLLAQVVFIFLYYRDFMPH